jgi:MFS family permease
MPRNEVKAAAVWSERIAVVATGSAFFMVILDTSVVNLALPSIAAELHVGLAGLQWIVHGYALVFASLLLGAGSLGDGRRSRPRLDRRRIRGAGVKFQYPRSRCCS